MDNLTSYTAAAKAIIRRGRYDRVSSDDARKLGSICDRMNRKIGYREYLQWAEEIGLATEQARRLMLPVNQKRELGL